MLLLSNWLRHEKQEGIKFHRHTVAKGVQMNMSPFLGDDGGVSLEFVLAAEVVAL